MSFALPFNSDVTDAHLWESLELTLSHRARGARRSDSSRPRTVERETVAVPEDASQFEQWRKNRLNDYFGSKQPPQQDPRGRQPLLPEDTATTLARRYGTPPERL